MAIDFLTTYPQLHVGNVTSGWIVFLYKSTGGVGFTISTAPTRAGYPIIKNKPTIRTSINLAKSTAKTSDITLVCMNEYLPSQLLSTVLLDSGGSDHYINQEVQIFQSFNPDGADETQIYTGRLVDVSHDYETCTLKIQSARPWDFLTMPTDTHFAEPATYVPVVYGNSWNKNLSTYNVPLSSDGYLYAVPVTAMNKDEIHTLMPRAYVNGSYCHLNHRLGKRIYLPLAWSSGGFDDETHIEGNQNTLRTDPEMHQTGWVAGSEHTDRNPTGDTNRVFFTDTHYLFDRDYDTFSTVYCNTGYNHYFGISTGASTEFESNWVRGVKFDAKDSGGDSFYVYLFDGTTTWGALDVTLTATPQTISFTGITPPPRLTTPLGILFIRYSGGATTISVQNCIINLKNTPDTDDGEEMHKLSKVEHFYSGGDGLTQSWLGGSTSTPISLVHEAHRDILARFTGIDETVPEGYSSLHGDRTNWYCRYSLGEPEKVQKILEKLQYEGGFIFTFTASGLMRYIHIPSSPSADWTWSDDDLSGVSISHTPFSELLTKWNILYCPHPDGNGYMDSEIFTNSASRTKWNIQTDENINKVSLVALVAPGTTNFFAHYDGIFGDIKIIISGEIINHAKWGVEVGDIVTFTDLTLKAYNTDLGASDYFMITDLTRSLDSLKFKAREVG